MRVAKVEPVFLSAPLAAPVATPFGAVDRSVCLLVRIEDADGAVGWGEAWCNFPRFGGLHRARIIAELLAPILFSEPVNDVPATFRRLSELTRLAAIQSGEPGPVAQAIAGVDVALWDLAARRAGQPLWELLGGAAGSVPVYASLGWAPAVGPCVSRCLGRGFRAFKLKTPGDAARHVPALRELRWAAGEEVEVMADANQTWPLVRAAEMAREFAPFRLSWLEEPLPAFAPQAAWEALARPAPMPLAAGENLSGDAEFDPYLASGACRVLQPDMAKWGGFSGCLPLARRIRAAGARFCPHWFGGGIGQLASAHLLAAAGGDGLIEVGVNPDPLRDDLVPLAALRHGRLPLPEGPGLGAEPDPEVVARYRVKG